MTTEEWIDCSNYSGVPSSAQVAYLHDQGVTGAVIGLQDSYIARGQKELLGDLLKETYVDLPGRELRIAPPGSIIWIDVESGCFQLVQDVRRERNRIKYYGFQPGIYTNQGGMAALNFTDEFADLPLWYANPDLIAFSPFCGWTEMAMWQYTSTTQMLGFGVDRNKRMVADPQPQPDPLPDPGDFALSLASAIEFRRRGWLLKDLGTADKANLRWAVSQL